MQQLGCEVHVLTAGDTVSQGMENDLRVARFPITGKGHLLSPHRGAIKQLQAYLSENHWDIVFMHCWQAWNTNCLLDFYTSTPGAEKLILVSHGVSTNINIHPFPLNWIRRFLWLPYRRFTVPKYLRLLTTLVVLWEQYDNDRFFDQKLAHRLSVPLTVIPNVSRYNAMEVKRPFLQFSDQELSEGFLLSVGNYSEEKNEAFVLDAYRRSRMTDIPLIFVGHQHNDYSAKLTKHVKAWDLRKVQFCERLSKAEIDWLYMHAKLFLCGSKTECQPMVILDCLASETPFVCTDVGCVRSLSSGLVVTDVDQMAAQLRFLLHHSIGREELARNGRYIYEKQFSYASVAAKWESLLNKILHHPKSQCR
jgi:glycosyltransferase involved in cell wall biosynthesis